MQIMNTMIQHSLMPFAEFISSMNQALVLQLRHQAHLKIKTSSSP